MLTVSRSFCSHGKSWDNQVTSDCFTSFSVIIPYFNNRGTIVRALQSVSQQTFEPVQIIIIDDGCHDMALFHLVKDFGIQLIQLDQNLGSASARTEGAKNAIGSHVALLDSDDAWHPNHLEIHKNMWLQSNKNVCAISTNMSQESDSLERNEFEPLMDIFKYPRKVSPISLMFSNPMWNSATTFNLHILKSLNYWVDVSPSYAEDYDLLAKSVARGYSLSKSRSVTGMYFPQNESKSRKINAVFSSRISSALKILGVLEFNTHQKYLLKKVLGIYLWMSYTLQFAKSNQQYEEFRYAQLGNSFLLKTINPVLGNSTVWRTARKVLNRMSCLSPRVGMKRG